MAGDSFVKDLGEVLEFYGEPERLGLSARDLARYLIHQLAGLTEALRALPVPRNAEAGADGEPESVGAQDLFSSEQG